MNIMCGMGEVVTTDPKHKQWDCGLGYYKPGVVYYKQDENGYVIIDGKRCKLVEKPDTSDPTVAILNGEVLKNDFYKNPNDDIICSTMVDSISLPDGYSKCYYIHNSNPTSGTTALLTTTYKLVEKYGHAYCSAKINTLNTTYGSIYSNGPGGANNVTRMLLGVDDTRCILYSNMAGNQGGTTITRANRIFSYELTEDGKYREILVDTEYRTLNNYVQGNPNTDPNLYFLSTGSDVNIYFMFVVDDNKNVTFCAIPCQNDSTGQFGIYDVVSRQFYGNDALTGVLLPKVKFIYEKIGDKIYKTVKIGNLQWMCENLDYKWDGLDIGMEGTESPDVVAAGYPDDDEDTWGWNGRKVGLYYTQAARQMIDDKIEGWRLPTHEEVMSLRDLLTPGPDDPYYNPYEPDNCYINEVVTPDVSWYTYKQPPIMNKYGLSLLPTGYADYGSVQPGNPTITYKMYNGEDTYGLGLPGDFYEYGFWGTERNIYDPVVVRLVKDV